MRYAGEMDASRRHLARIRKCFAMKVFSFRARHRTLTSTIHLRLSYPSRCLKYKSSGALVLHRRFLGPSYDSHCVVVYVPKRGGFHARTCMPHLISHMNKQRLIPGYNDRLCARVLDAMLCVEKNGPTHIPRPTSGQFDNYLSLHAFIQSAVTRRDRAMVIS